MTLAIFLQAWGPWITGLAVGTLPWLKLWSDSQAAHRKDRADLVKIAQEAAASVIKDLRDEADRLQDRVAALEDELSTLRRDHAETVAAKDAKITLLEGQLRQALAESQAYHRLLSANGIVHAPPKQTFYELEGGEVQPLVSTI